jgi:hypothetical protein
MFFELLGMDVYDLTQAIAASKHRQDRPGSIEVGRSKHGIPEKTAVFLKCGYHWVYTPKMDGFSKCLKWKIMENPTKMKWMIWRYP